MKKSIYIFLVSLLAFLGAQAQPGHYHYGSKWGTVNIHGNVIIDSNLTLIKVPSQVETDTTVWKPVIINSAGSVRSSYWFGAGISTGGRDTTALNGVFRKAGTDSVFAVINSDTLFAFIDSIGTGTNIDTTNQFISSAVLDADSLRFTRGDSTWAINVAGNSPSFDDLQDVSNRGAIVSHTVSTADSVFVWYKNNDGGSVPLGFRIWGSDDPNMYMDAYDYIGDPTMRIDAQEGTGWIRDSWRVGQSDDGLAPNSGYHSFWSFDGSAAIDSFVFHRTGIMQVRKAGTPHYYQHLDFTTNISGGNKTSKLPNSDGTLANSVTVNGGSPINADANGNLAITLTGSGDNLHSVTTIGNRTTNKVLLGDTINTPSSQLDVVVNNVGTTVDTTEGVIIVNRTAPTNAVAQYSGGLSLVTQLRDTVGLTNSYVGMTSFIRTNAGTSTSKNFQQDFKVIGSNTTPLSLFSTGNVWLNNTLGILTSGGTSVQYYSTVPQTFSAGTTSTNYTFNGGTSLTSGNSVVAITSNGTQPLLSTALSVTGLGSRVLLKAYPSGTLAYNTTTIANPSFKAALDIASLGKGVIFPRMDSSQRDGIPKRVATVTITNGGAGISGTVGITATTTGIPAVFTPTIVGGAVTAILINDGGSNYTSGGSLIFDTTGTGATVLPTGTYTVTTDTIPEGTIVFNNQSGKYQQYTAARGWENFVEGGSGGGGGFSSTTLGGDVIIDGDSSAVIFTDISQFTVQEAADTDPSLVLNAAGFLLGNAANGEPNIVSEISTNKLNINGNDSLTLSAQKIKAEGTDFLWNGVQVATTAITDLKLNISDTSAMNSAQQTAILALQSSVTTNTSNIALKLNISDTSAMNSAQQSAIVANTAAIATNTSNIALKLNISDTAAMDDAQQSAITTLQSSVATNTANIVTNTTAISYRYGDVNRGYQLLGSTIKVQPMAGMINNISQSTGITNGQARYTAVYIPMDQTITGAKWYQTLLQSGHTASGYNGIGLYSYNTATGVMTLIASSTNSSTIWSGGAATAVNQIAFSSPVAVTEGVYFIGMHLNVSVAGTAPTFGHMVNGVNANTMLVDFTNQAKLSGTLSTTTATTPINISTLGAVNNTLWMALY